MNGKATVNVRELRENLVQYLSQASHGNEVTVTSHGKQIAKIVPAVQKKTRAEAFGSMRGKIVIAPDFDETPQDILDAAERWDE